MVADLCADPLRREVNPRVHSVAGVSSLFRFWTERDAAVSGLSAAVPGPRSVLGRSQVQGTGGDLQRYSPRDRAAGSKQHSFPIIPTVQVKCRAANASGVLLVSLSKMSRRTAFRLRPSIFAPRHFRSRLATNRQHGFVNATASGRIYAYDTGAVLAL